MSRADTGCARRWAAPALRRDYEMLHGVMTGMKTALGVRRPKPGGGGLTGVGKGYYEGA